jgi:hypothetical protein
VSATLILTLVAIYLIALAVSGPSLPLACSAAGTAVFIVAIHLYQEHRGG